MIKDILNSVVCRRCIQMKRFDGDDVSVVMEIETFDEEQEDVVLVDTELVSRFGVVVTSSISDAG